MLLATHQLTEAKLVAEDRRESSAPCTSTAPNYTIPSLPLASEVTCNYAYLACTYRAGCGLALKQYVAMCEDLVQGVTTMCSMGCRHPLIALMSTHKGERLMQVGNKGTMKRKAQMIKDAQN